MTAEVGGDHYGGSAYGRETCLRRVIRESRLSYIYVVQLDNAENGVERELTTIHV